MKRIRVGIMGLGKIAGVMAKTLHQMDQVELYAAASRDREKAAEFAAEYGFSKAYGSYEELARDGQVDLIYIATPHSEHLNNARLCLENGRNVLCEKAFAANKKQAKEMIALAETKKLLLTEAMWVRYMPMARTLREVLASGVIGEPRMLTANLCYLIDGVPRILDPALAGGALLDVGVYTLTFASLVFGDEIKEIRSTAVLSHNGVDLQNSITLLYECGRMAVLNSSVQTLSDRQGVIYGTKGYVLVENVNNFQSIQVFGPNRELLGKYTSPKQISGYEYQVEACIEAMEEGWTQCPQMTHEMTLSVMGVMDELRKQWGVRYPFED